MFPLPVGSPRFAHCCHLSALLEETTCFPPPPVQSLVFLVTAASSPVLHPSDHSWSPHTGGHDLLSVERAHSLLPLPPYFSLRLPCLLLDFCFLTFPGNCIIPCPPYFTEPQSILIASYPGFCFSSNGLGPSL